MSETGNLIVYVYTGSSAVPVEGASVSVLNRNADDTLSLLAFRGTGIGGSTGSMTFDTPPESASLTAGSDMQAYTSVDIMVDRPGYYGVLIRGVPVFSGQDSIQTVQMIPLPELTQLAGGGGTVEYFIPASTL
ncbi:MAG: hypothetical protein ACI4VM_00675 [Anaerovoracaceae bacterium]